MVKRERGYKPQLLDTSEIRAVVLSCIDARLFETASEVVSRWLGIKGGIYDPKLMGGLKTLAAPTKESHAETVLDNIKFVLEHNPDAMVVGFVHEDCAAEKATGNSFDTLEEWSAFAKKQAPLAEARLRSAGITAKTVYGFLYASSENKWTVETIPLFEELQKAA